MTERAYEVFAPEGNKKQIWKLIYCPLLLNFGLRKYFAIWSKNNTRLCIQMSQVISVFQIKNIYQKIPKPDDLLLSSDDNHIEKMHAGIHGNCCLTVKFPKL